MTALLEPERPRAFIIHPFINVLASATKSAAKAAAAFEWPELREAHGCWNLTAPPSPAASTARRCEEVHGEGGEGVRVVRR